MSVLTTIIYCMCLPNGALTVLHCTSVLAAHRQYLCSGSRDTCLRLWDTGTQQCVRQQAIARNLVSRRGRGRGGKRGREGVILCLCVCICAFVYLEPEWLWNFVHTYIPTYVRMYICTSQTVKDYEWNLGAASVYMYACRSAVLS